MTNHDKIVLKICRNYLNEGVKLIKIGSRVVARQKIITKLRNEFPNRIVT